MAIGTIQDSKGGHKPVSVVTSDGGAHWDVGKLEENPVSLFFLNDTLADGHGMRDSKTEESGKDWKKLPNRRPPPRSRAAFWQPS